MKKATLPYEATGYFSSAVTDYINGSEKLKPFYSYSVAVNSFPSIIEQRKKFPLHREVLHEVLMKQYEPFVNGESNDEVRNNIVRLKDSNTFTVVTAHQPNLFLGPLYLIYKIVSAINLSRQLNTEFPGFHFVPVYWMGSEDHDKEELNNVHIFSKTFTWHTEQEGAFGRMKTKTLAPLIEEIKTLLGSSEEAQRCIKLIEECYLNEDNIAAATKKILYHFFAADGLVIADGDDPALKQLFTPVLKKELMDQFSFPVVKNTSEAFSKNHASQITPREINLFYLDEGIRQRIVREGALWKVLNTSLAFSAEEITSLLQTHPEKFSPNVILRPVYQEFILPNVAFIGGGAEVTYWMQLKELFSVAGVAFPMILLRNSVLWIDGSHHSRMNKLDLSPEEIFLPVAGLVNKFLEKQAGDVILLDTEKAGLKKLMDGIMQRMLLLDASMKGAVEAEAVKMQKSLESMEDKMKRAVKKKEEVSLQQLQTLKEKLFPANGLQERHDNFLPFYMKYGDQFFSALKLHLYPLEQQFTVLLEEV